MTQSTREREAVGNAGGSEVPWAFPFFGAHVDVGLPMPSLSLWGTSQCWGLHAKLGMDKSGCRHPCCQGPSGDFCH